MRIINTHNGDFHVRGERKKILNTENRLYCIIVMSVNKVRIMCSRKPASQYQRDEIMQDPQELVSLTRQGFREKERPYRETVMLMIWSISEFLF